MHKMNCSCVLTNNLFSRIFLSKNKCNMLLSTTVPLHDDQPNIKNIKKIVGFIGDGNMAKAICRSIVSKGLITYSQVYVSSPYKNHLDIWAKWNANVTTNNNEVGEKADVIFLAVKPHILPGVIAEMQKEDKSKVISNKLFVSILAGMTIKTLERKLSKFDGARVIRVMPNTPMLVGEGCTVYCPGKNATDADVSLVKTILEVTGICHQVPEDMINAVAAVSGSGPSFVYLVIEALSDGAVKMGLPRELATQFAAQTVFGGAKMVLETGKHTGALKDEVCSAGGTTIAGMYALEKGGVRGAIMSAVEAAAKRADELGQEK